MRHASAAKGMRQPRARYHEEQAEAEEPVVFVPTAIHGSRQFEGKDQYEVQWEGYPYTTWCDADSLTCVELIEEFECGDVEQ